jgi:mannose-6-phosphate isomerase-like protein (cupin superfamily)
MQKTIANLCLMAACAATPAGSQPSPTGAAILFTPAAQVNVILARLERERPADQPFISAPIAKVGAYEENLELNVGTAAAAIHEREVEFLYVVKGSAILVTGGALRGALHRTGETVSSPGVSGGVARKVAQGDFIAVPAKTAHGFSQIDGEIAVISLHLPAQQYNNGAGRIPPRVH